MTFPTDPERLRRDIERTQQNLSTDVDRLAEKVTPGRIVHRRVDRARNAVTRMRDRVMGTTPNGDVMSTARDRLGDAASSVADSTSSAASNVAQAVQEAPQAVRRGTEGNPLAAGLIAFGAGWLLSTLAPASRTEQRLTERAKEAAQEYGQPVAEHLGQAATDLRDNLREPAQQAAESVRQTATVSTSSRRCDPARSMLSTMDARCSRTSGRHGPG